MDSAKPLLYPRYPPFLPLNPQIITENTFSLLYLFCQISSFSIPALWRNYRTYLVFAECRIITGSLWGFRLGILEMKLNLSPLFSVSVYLTELKVSHFTDGSYDYGLEEIQLHCSTSYGWKVCLCWFYPPYFLHLYICKSFSEGPYFACIAWCYVAQYVACALHQHVMSVADGHFKYETTFFEYETIQIGFKSSFHVWHEI